VGQPHIKTKEVAMKYRVRADMRFETETDARDFASFAQGLVKKARNMNPGASNEEESFVELTLDRADEGLPAISLSRTAIKTVQEVGDAQT
jgi:hypothetical protein